jgi:hypothetical protein
MVSRTQRERTIVSDYNAQMIDEFRANDGRVGDPDTTTPGSRNPWGRDLPLCSEFVQR